MSVWVLERPREMRLMMHKGGTYGNDLRMLATMCMQVDDVEVFSQAFREGFAEM